MNYFVGQGTYWASLCSNTALYLTPPMAKEKGTDLPHLMASYICSSGERREGIIVVLLRSDENNRFEEGLF